MAYVDINLDNFDTSELVSELENRWLDYRDKQTLLNYIKDDECVKLSLFFKVKDRFTVNELEQLFGENTPIEVSPNQLALAI